MKTTQYFRYTRSIQIVLSLKMNGLNKPFRIRCEKNGSLMEEFANGRIAEMENRALRVILLEDGETVHNAFFDRNFKE